MDGQYSMADITQFMNTITPADNYPSTLIPILSHHYDTPPMLTHQHHHHEAAAGAGASLVADAGPASTTTHGYFEVEPNTGRWPRQETLCLLEIRSKLDSKFKEANQKGPVWDELSRIMAEEHGYQRSGKKCREKFENLYKYYKKTKDGKAGRQDGKHYRFFKQLESIYGTEQLTNPNSESHFLGDMSSFRFQQQKTKQLISDRSNSSELDTSSTSNDQVLIQIKEFMDSQMRKLMEKQDEWLEKMMKTMDRKDEERVLKEEEWRKQDADRVEREYLFWAKEKAWIEARDASLMEALKKLTGNEQLNVRSGYEMNGPNIEHDQFAASCVSNGIQDSCFRFLMMGDGENLWGSYGLNLNKEENH
ncbi:trihelix transcription factor PTL-like [Impatiens glandulifera]|uniref:trihelix transcription factor PTL-like n=1 Tax=Impatiens glandulifera TaxID=253017 RepID=UPI001FB0A255|nr:trihelix transcription factor PTL-like [Impatiens glandulifera]